ncbi:hypothetical protein PBRA_009278 [Plasmodiophora brassicae]|uniref:Uncharacterized protein n=1 Tax=Plasmodiophora brassicae TaxID=37360 RepID=A0A0G4J656_PLABS|nr:hypothetical protein PBRA_009278 [Plasmodiophora brassicae]
MRYSGMDVAANIMSLEFPEHQAKPFILSLDIRCWIHQPCHTRTGKRSRNIHGLCTTWRHAVGSLKRRSRESLRLLSTSIKCHNLPKCEVRTCKVAGATWPSFDNRQRLRCGIR